MSSPILSMDDLHMVVAIADFGSLGGAARSLHLRQPSLSQRLALLERRLGVTLFERSPTGARPTAAGQQFAGDARQVLAIVEDSVATVRATGGRRRLRVGTIASLGPVVISTVDEAIGDAYDLAQRTDHGPALVRDVAAGLLDLAVVALPTSVLEAPRTRLTALGADQLVTFLPDGVEDLGRGRGPKALDGRVIVLSTYSSHPERVAERLVRRGGSVRLASTAPIALAMARGRNVAAIVPRSTAVTDLRPGERISPAPVSTGVPLSMITGPRIPDTIAGLAPALTRRLRLTAP